MVKWSKTVLCNFPATKWFSKYSFRIVIPKNEPRLTLMNVTAKLLLTITLLVALPGLAFAKKDHKKKIAGERVDWKTVPAAAQATIRSNSAGGKVTEVDKETKNGIVLYRAEVKGTDGKRFQVAVSEAGKLMKVKAEDDRRKHKHKGLFGF